MATIASVDTARGQLQRGRGIGLLPPILQIWPLFALTFTRVSCMIHPEIDTLNPTATTMLRSWCITMAAAVYRQGMHLP